MRSTIEGHHISIVINPDVTSEFDTMLDVGSESDWIAYHIEIQAADLSKVDATDILDDPEPTTIGRAVVYRFNAASANLGEHTMEIADEPSNEVYEIVATMRPHKMLTYPRQAFPGVKEPPINGDILHLEEFNIEEKWEGKGVDLLVAELIIRNLGHGASITTMADDTVREQATRHWGRIGLTPYPTNPNILWHPCGYIRRPKP